MKTASEIYHHSRIPEEMSGKRLDQVLAFLFPQYSRTRLKNWLEAGQITINQKQNRPKDKVLGGEEIIIQATIEADLTNRPENIPLEIVFEDDDLIIVNKSAGMVVHPAAGNPSQTLLNALLHHVPELSTLPRAGIIHRIDKDTSGLLVVAKTLETYTVLVKQLQAHKISREYEAIVHGVMTGGGKINESIGRHPRQRTKMAVVDSGKEAITYYWVIERFKAYTHIKVKLETGRTHQIRVHMAHHHHPILGDQIYGGRLRLPKGVSEKLKKALRTMKRQVLHAKRLEFIHPKTKEFVSFEAALPEDMQLLLEALKE